MFFSYLCHHINVIPMNKRLFLFAAMALIAACVLAQPLRQDATIRMGKLKNGMTYYLRHNGKDPKMADFYIAQRVGSIQEEPRQRGLAHL